jgi:hypothetical protein
MKVIAIPFKVIRWRQRLLVQMFLYCFLYILNPGKLWAALIVNRDSQHAINAVANVTPKIHPCQRIQPLSNLFKDFV